MEKKPANHTRPQKTLTLGLHDAVSLDLVVALADKFHEKT